jgi:hypothetical protein
MNRRLVLALAAAALLSAADVKKPDYSGKWKINVAQSQSPNGMVPTTYERVIEHKDPAVSVQTTIGMNGNERVSSAKFTTDGKEAVNQVNGREAKTKASWLGDKLLIENRLEFGGNAITSLETWSLSQDGKSLAVDYKLTSPQGEMSSKLVFDKQ